MSLNLKEFIEKTRYDTGVSTDTIVEGIRKINIQEIKDSLLHSDSTKMINSMMKTMLKMRMEDNK